MNDVSKVSTPDQISSHITRTSQTIQIINPIQLYDAMMWWYGKIRFVAQHVVHALSS